MAPSAAAVMRSRYWTSCAIRIIALAMVAWGLLGFLSAALEHLPHLLTGGNPIVLAWMAIPLRWAILAAILLAAQSRIIRWLFPLPSSGCPQCNYPIAGRPVGACPECGLVLAADRTLNPPAPPGY